MVIRCAPILCATMLENGDIALAVSDSCNCAVGNNGPCESSQL